MLKSASLFLFSHPHPLYNHRMIDLHTLAAVLLIFAFAHLGLGRELPFDTASAITLASQIVFFAAYLYLLRTLVRLPIALVITIRRTRHALRQYQLGRMESLRDGYTRGFLDARRWTVQPLALIDRVTVCVATLLATLPAGRLLVTFGGILGISLLLVIYLMRGTFGWLVADSINTSLQPTASFPFIRTRD